MITIIDYGLGNIQAFLNIYKRLNIPVKTASNASELKDVEKLILPGVGAFDWAMNRLNASGMRELIDELVLEKNYPILGVCVGMQIMANKSDEGELPGLGWINGKVSKFPDRRHVCLPHMGWNDVHPKTGNSLFHDLEKNSRFYFLHSYYFIPENEEDVIAETDYFGRFPSCIGRNNILGVQFHPEKSHSWGVQLLKNFAGM